MFIITMHKNPKLIKLLPVFVAIVAITAIPLASNAFAQTDEITDVAPDIQRIPNLTFEGKTNGWALVNGQAHPAGLTLDGKAIFNEERGVWHVKSDSALSVGDRDAKVELKGKVTDNKLRLFGTGVLNDGTEFKIILRGHYAPIANSDGDFAVAFKTAIVSTTNTDESIRIPLALVGQVETEIIEPVVVDTTSQEIDEYLKELEA